MDVLLETVQHLTNKMRGFDSNSIDSSSQRGIVRSLASSNASIKVWASSPERFLTISTWLGSEKSVVVREARSLTERMGLASCFQAEVFEQFIISRKSL